MLWQYSNEYHGAGAFDCGETKSGYRDLQQDPLSGGFFNVSWTRAPDDKFSITRRSLQNAAEQLMLWFDTICGYIACSSAEPSPHPQAAADAGLAGMSTRSA
jgi:hypothetical protein